jgi:hypothetical protein
MTPLPTPTYSDRPGEHAGRVMDHQFSTEAERERAAEYRITFPNEVIENRPWSDVVAILVQVQTQLRNYGTLDVYSYGSKFTPEQYAAIRWAAELLDPAIVAAQESTDADK